MVLAGRLTFSGRPVPVLGHTVRVRSFGPVRGSLADRRFRVGQRWKCQEYKYRNSLHDVLYHPSPTTRKTKTMEFRDDPVLIRDDYVISLP